VEFDKRAGWRQRRRPTPSSGNGPDFRAALSAWDRTSIIPKRRPVHRVTVDFVLPRPARPSRTGNSRNSSRQPVHNHVRLKSLPIRKDYPGALPHMLYAGSLVFTPPPRPVDLRNWGEWWTFLKGADWRHPYGPKKQYQQSRQSSGGPRLVRGLPSPTARLGWQGSADRGPSGSSRARRRARRRRICVGETSSLLAASIQG